MKPLIGALENASTKPAPPIEVYLPEGERRNGIGAVIFPGGGYEELAEHEGKNYAELFRKKGIACFVVRYRLGSDGHKHPAMLEDALAAIAAIRRRAEEFGVNPSRLGVMGSSAGAHLAALSIVSCDRYRSSIPLRPDFGVLCYPVILMSGKHCHNGSRTRLIGENPSEALVDEVSCERHVSPRTPPCFIWHTWEDAVVPVENSMIFASALREHGVPFEMHIYQRGGHGLGIKTSLPWPDDCVRWLDDIFADKPPR